MKSFLNESIISQDSLLNDLKKLTETGYIERMSKYNPYRYRITPKGRKYRNQIVQVITRKVKPPSINTILDTTSRELFTLDNNPFLLISDLKKQG